MHIEAMQNKFMGGATRAAHEISVRAPVRRRDRNLVVAPSCNVPRYAHGNCSSLPPCLPDALLAEYFARSHEPTNPHVSHWRSCDPLSPFCAALRHDLSPTTRQDREEVLTNYRASSPSPSLPLPGRSSCAASSPCLTDLRIAGRAVSGDGSVAQEG